MPVPHRPAASARATRRTPLALALVLSVATAALTAIPPAHAAGTTLEVDLSRGTGEATGVGSGFLYGLSQDGSQPGDDLLAPLAVRSARGGGARIDGHGWVGDGYRPGNGYRVRLDSALAQARRLAAPPHSAHYDLLVSDVWGADTTQPADTVYPCANDDCGNWTTFLDQLIADVRASGTTVRFDIWNEPSGAFFPPGWGSPQFYRMWDTAVREIRRQLPDAVIVGPSRWDFDPGGIRDFLTHAKQNDTLPTVLNWHFSRDPVADARTARAMIADLGLPPMELAMNEYLHAEEQHAGYQAWYLARLAASGISSASHAVWSDCCTSPTLDSVLVRAADGSLRPTGQWWTYKAYADVTGTLAPVSGGGETDAVAAADPGRRRVTALLGTTAGSAPSADLVLDRLDGLPWLAGPSGVKVTVERIPDSAPLDQPVVVSTVTLEPGTSRATVPVTWAAATDAFAVTLTPAG